MLEAGGQLGQGAGGLVEGGGGPADGGLLPGPVDQEGLAGRALPGAGDDHERGRPAEPAADVPQGAGGGAHAPGPGGQGSRVAGRPAHGRWRAGDGGWCGIGGSSPDDGDNVAKRLTEL